MMTNLIVVNYFNFDRHLNALTALTDWSMITSVTTVWKLKLLLTNKSTALYFLRMIMAEESIWNCHGWNFLQIIRKKTKRSNIGYIPKFSADFFAQQKFNGEFGYRLQLEVPPKMMTTTMMATTLCGEYRLFSDLSDVRLRTETSVDAPRPTTFANELRVEVRVHLH